MLERYFVVFFVCYIKADREIKRKLLGSDQ